jgi:hypothetical protein
MNQEKQELAGKNPPRSLMALDGLCRPCADAEFYGLRVEHRACAGGSCRCSYVVPAADPPGTWPASWTQDTLPGMELPDHDSV